MKNGENWDFSDLGIFFFGGTDWSSEAWVLGKTLHLWVWSIKNRDTWHKSTQFVNDPGHMMFSWAWNSGVYQLVWFGAFRTSGVDRVAVFRPRCRSCTANHVQMVCRWGKVEGKGTHTILLGRGFCSDWEVISLGMVVWKWGSKTHDWPIGGLHGTWRCSIFRHTHLCVYVNIHICFVYAHPKKQDTKSNFPRYPEGYLPNSWSWWLGHINNQNMDGTGNLQIWCFLASWFQVSSVDGSQHGEFF